MLTRSLVLSRFGALRCSLVARGLYAPTQSQLDLLESFQKDQSMELSLFQDPSAGLTLNEAVEMSPTELQRELSIASSAYHPVVYAVSFMPTIDIARIMLETCCRGSRADSSLALDGRPERAISKWLNDPRVLLTRGDDETSPLPLTSAMGAELFTAFQVALLPWFDDVDTMSPMRRVLRRYRVDGRTLLPAFRYIGCKWWSRNRAFRESLEQRMPGMMLALCGQGGEVFAPSLGGVDDDNRVRFFADFLIAVGEETGNAGPAFLGMQLLRAAHLPVPYRSQKSMTNVFAAISRRNGDWDLRMSGKLDDAIPRWASLWKRERRVDGVPLQTTGEAADVAAEEALVVTLNPSTPVFQRPTAGASVEEKHILDATASRTDAVSVTGYFRRDDSAKRESEELRQHIVRRRRVRQQ